MSWWKRLIGKDDDHLVATVEPLPHRSPSKEAHLSSKGLVNTATMPWVCESCGHGFTVSVIGLTVETEIACQDCGVVEHVTDANLAEIDAQFLAQCEALAAEPFDFGDQTAAMMRFARMNNRFPTVDELGAGVLTNAPRQRRPAPRSETTARPAMHASRPSSAATNVSANMRFVAIDVETANPHYHSICQIGVVLFEAGEEVAAERILVDPREDFGPWQIRVHGILPEHVAGSPCFSDHYDWLHRWTAGEIVVSHSNFDRAALGQACALHRLPLLGCQWVDSVGIAMAAWPELQSYKLGEIASRLGISFRAHDALEDARACGLIVQRALAGEPLVHSGLGTTSGGGGRRWSGDVRRTGDGDGGLLGETIVFTGELAIPRPVAADMAAEAGADVIPGPTRHMSMLVVGDRDLQPGWQAKSSKHRKVEELIEKGFDIRIVGEADFLALAAIKD